MNRLAIKAWVAMMALVAFLLVGLGFYVSRLVQRFYLDQATVHLLEHGRFLSQVLTSMDPKGISMYLPLFSHLSQAQVTVVNREGQVVASSGILASLATMPLKGSEAALYQLGIEPGTYLSTQAVQQVLRGQTVERVGFSPLMGKHVISVGLPLKRGRAVAGGILLFASAAAVSQELTPLWWTLILGFAGAAVLAAIAAYFLSRRISGPLAGMQRAAVAMAEGDFSLRVWEEGTDELGSLGRSINRLAAAVDHSIQRLSQERDRLDDILESLSEGVLTISADGRLLSDNHSAAAFFPTGIPPELVDLVQSRLNRQGSNGGEFSFGSRWLAVHVTPLGAGGGAVVVVSDVTAERSVEERRRAFLADISHELRTPLSLVQGYAEALLDGVADEGAIGRYLSVILDETHRLRRLVEELMELSRLEVEIPSPANGEAIDLFAWTAKVASRFEPAAAEQEVRLELDLPNGDGPVLAPPDRLERILVNLLSNALRHTPPTGMIRLRGTTLGQWVRLDVEDTGEGIPPDDLTRIFERFYRVDKGRSRAQGGSGLGLAIVRAAVVGLDGQVWAESPDGGGTRFVVQLPRRKSAGPAFDPSAQEIDQQVKLTEEAGQLDQEEVDQHPQAG